MHLLDGLLQLRQLHHRRDAEFQLLVVVGARLYPSPDKEEIVAEKVFAEILVILAEKREFVRAVVILQLELSPRLSGLGR